MRTPLISITLAFLAGLLLGHGFLYFPITAAALALTALLAGTILAVAQRLAVRRLFVALLACLAGSFSLLHSAATLPPDHYLRAFPFNERKHIVTGRIVSALDRDPGRTAFLVALESIDGKRASGRMRVSVRDDRSPAGYGDVVRISGRVYEPRGFRNPGGFDYAGYLARQGVFATMSARDFSGMVVLRRSRGIFRAVQDWRERIRLHFLAATAGPGSAVLQAMVLGEEGGLTDEVRDGFMAAGVTHILSISGSHLGLVALVCFGLIRWMLFLLPERLILRLTLHADPKKIAAALTLLPVVFYALLAGGQTATLRSLVMILAALAAVLLDREDRLMHSLAAAALAILIAGPQALFDISFQLSFLSVLSIGYVVSVWKELSVPRRGLLRRTANGILLLVVVSLVASLSTGPLVAYYFNQVSLAGIVSNLLVVPFAGFVVVPLGLVSGILSLVLDRIPLPALNQAAADAFYGLVSFFSRFPFAEFHPPSPGPLALIAFGVFLLSAAAFTRARLFAAFKPFESSRRIPGLPVIGMAVSGMVLLAAIGSCFLPHKSARITFLDVGQGDCALIELPAGRNILIDAGGTHDNRFDIGRKVVAPYLRDRGVSRLYLAVLSHPHPDHMNGFFFIANKFRISGFWDSGHDRDLPGYGELQRIIAERGIPARTVTEGYRESPADGIDLSVVLPRPGDRARTRKKGYAAENNRSLVVSLKLHDRTMLFTGDIGAEAVTGLVRANRGIRCDVLKVPHHGSRYSAPDELLRLTRPAAAVVSAGKGNPYRHPSPEVIERYEQGGARIFRTDRDGAVIVIVERDGMRIIPWAEMVLKRISLSDAKKWPEVERRNWKRAWERIWN